MYRLPAGNMPFRNTRRRRMLRGFRGQRNADHDHGDSKMRLKFNRDRATAPVLTSEPRDSSIRPRDGTRSFPCPTFPRVWGPCPDEPLTIFVWSGTFEGLSETRSNPRKIDYGHRFLPEDLSTVSAKPRWHRTTYEQDARVCAGWLIEFPPNSRR